MGKSEPRVVSGTEGGGDSPAGGAQDWLVGGVRKGLLHDAALPQLSSRSWKPASPPRVPAKTIAHRVCWRGNCIAALSFPAKSTGTSF